ncbi:MAG: hypothetical protein J6B43_08990 [Lachnospiraceae bacterium]|nr:hypothetical protein [Lachnospiraceae bacterium]
MDNKKREKQIPAELDDHALEKVTGGMGVTVEVTDSHQNTGVDGSSYAGGIVGYASSGEIKNC